MELKQLFLKRESCRNFSGKKVNKQIILSILDEARLAPSARNNQPWHFWIVENQETFQALVAPLRSFTQKAGGMVILTKPKNLEYGIHDYSDIDAGIVTAYITLAAINKGIQTCIIGSFHDEEIKSVVPALKDETIQLMILFGYSDDSPREKIRFELTNIANII